MAMKLVRRAVLGAALFLAAAGPGPAAPPAAVPVVMTTDLGVVELELYPDRAPLTVANFLRYVDEGRYAGATFYRVVRAATDPNPKAPIQVIQGGIDSDARRGQMQPPIAHETTATSGLSHTDGVISMARDGPGSATSEFFITVGDNTSLDFGGARNPDGQGYAAFGRVTGGMDVVRRIQGQPSDAPTDVVYVKGQILERPVEILTIRRK
ncbi:peptidylprolyl isomerase [Phenylobacterium sp.]|uniref:peptidylprolyl isomerase n=1 Tax=Phenylobacterium sp. TaxID=1871053 RepID=UPI00289C0B54|nr:peptidylprolyl isomerase [Phenylobacterium sp.]